MNDLEKVALSLYCADRQCIIFSTGNLTPEPDNLLDVYKLQWENLDENSNSKQFWRFLAERQFQIFNLLKEE